MAACFLIPLAISSAAWITYRKMNGGLAEWPGTAGVMYWPITLGTELSKNTCTPCMGGDSIGNGDPSASSELRARRRDQQPRACAAASPPVVGHSFGDLRQLCASGRRAGMPAAPRAAGRRARRADLPL